ncbi:MAG: alpha-rhamnosidase [Kiritimatiellia bacterium]|nr:alpha-rhamnosidase [Kiritimatiellia bacterium]
MKKLFVLAGLLASVNLLAGQEARWIWYPGDYGIWWGNEIQSQRLQWGGRLTPFWPLYEPHSRVLFRRAVHLTADEPLEIGADGHATVCWHSPSGYHEGSAILGKFTLPKDATAIEIKIQNNDRPPSVWVKGPHLVSDSEWKVGWTTTWDTDDDLPADSSARFTDPLTPPGLTSLPVERKNPVWSRETHGHGLLADFGEETYGYLRFKDIRGKGAVRVIYAESESEALAVDLANTKPGALDGWEMLMLEEGAEMRRDIAHGFRFVHVIPVDGEVSVGALAMDRETKGLPVRGSFRCSDAELNEIWDVSVRTLELTCREVFIEGIKRDHWVWSGDAVQSFLMNYYVFGDYDGCRDTLWTLRGKDPVKCHLNRIMDYTFYWFDAVEKYRLYSGDPYIARQVYPRMKTLLEFALGRLDAAGRPVDRPGDWMFIDWAPEPLHNTGGVTAFEQMLLVRALEATAALAKEVGAADDANAYLARAKKLRDEIVPRYWNEEKGGLLHLMKADGSLDEQLTRYPNMFGLFYGYFDEAKRARVVKDVLLNDNVLKIQTPYMRFYELESLCSLGMQETVTKEIKSYWGGMLNLGATSFWELYNPSEKGVAHYAMYGRRYGKSLCHAWGASPTYLLGKYYLGVTPTQPGFAAYEVKPNLGGLEWIEGDVPAPFGRIHVKFDKKSVSVLSDGGKGVLVLPTGQRVDIPAGCEISMPIP